jgi:NAD(P)H-hydrate epimerase
MRIATAQQISELDRRAAEDFGVPTATLMENAGKHVATVVSQLIEQRGGRRIVVLAGKGNNGGDGLVAARYIKNPRLEVSAYLTAPASEFDGDAAKALAAAREAWVPIHSLATAGSDEIEDLLGTADIIVDAIFGTGFRGPAREPAASMIAAANRTGKPIVAVDVPSGLNADTGKPEGPCIRATATVTMGLPKVGLVIYPGAEYVGQLYVADIGYPPGLSPDHEVPTRLVTADMVKSRIPARKPDTHKGTYGTVLVVAGAVGYTGAAAMTTLGALRAGAGLVRVAVPQAIYEIVASKVTEGMPVPLPDRDGALAPEAADRVVELAKDSTVVAVGPGLSMGPGTAEVVTMLLRTQTPLVIDADGLNVLAGSTERLPRSAPTIITPHPGELGRLLGVSASDVQRDRLQAARSAASAFRCVVLLKGARTVVAIPDGEAFIIPTGNPGMATGGMGDVLTGAIAALLGQGLDALSAAYAGAYVHGLAADLLAADRGQVGMLATEVADRLPAAIRRVQTGQYHDPIVHLTE